MIQLLSYDRLTRWIQVLLLQRVKSVVLRMTGRVGSRKILYPICYSHSISRVTGRMFQTSDSWLKKNMKCATRIAPLLVRYDLNE
jgi:hypothetical protein